MTQGLSRLTPRGRQWLATVREWEGSGLPIREFCVRQGLKPATLAWWRQEIKRLGDTQGGQEAVELVEIGHRGPRPGDNRFEVELGNGLRVRVPIRFDAAALKELLGVLGAC